MVIKVSDNTMINKIKSIKNNKLTTNFSYLIIIEIFQKILPFVTIPYIVSTIGVEKFGLITFAYAIIAYFQLLVDYGFNAIAVKNISLKRNSVKEYSKIFWSVVFSKLLMVIVSLIVLFFLIYTIDFLYIDRYVYIFSIGLIVSNFLFPIWFLQGVEEMKYIAILTIIGRILYTVSIFVFIKYENDFMLVPLLNSINLSVIAIVSFYFVIKKYKIPFLIPTVEDIKYYFKEGWHLFLSAATTNLYTTTNTILLGYFSNYSMVGIYTIAATVSGAFTQLIGQFNKVIYPHLSQYTHNREKLQIETRKYLKIYLSVLLALSILIFVFSDFLIYVLFGGNHQESVLILKVLAITLTLSSLGGFYTRYMIILAKQTEILKITTLTMILNFVIIIPSILIFQGLGVAITKVIVEAFQVYLNSKSNRSLLSIFKNNSKVGNKI